MRFKVGEKLLMLRNERRMTQEEMAELLSLSTSAYARVERNEVQPDFDFITRTAERLDVPLSRFLPDTLHFNNAHHNGQGGVVFGNFYYYANPDQSNVDIENERAQYLATIENLKQRISLLELQIRIYVDKFGKLDDII